MHDNDFLEDHIVEAAKQAVERPSDFGWFGHDEMFVTWGITGPHMTRDSGPLARSNFRVIRNDLYEKFPDDFEVEGVSHWACGWVDSVTCRVFDKKSYECLSCETIFTNDPANGMSFKTEFEHCPICRHQHMDSGYQIGENITPAFLALMEWRDSLEQYAVADESDYSEEEYKEFADTLRNCFDIPEESIEAALSYCFDELNACSYDDLRKDDLNELIELFGDNDES